MRFTIILFLILCSSTMFSQHSDSLVTSVVTPGGWMAPEIQTAEDCLSEINWVLDELNAVMVEKNELLPLLSIELDDIAMAQEQLLKTQEKVDTTSTVMVSDSNTVVSTPVTPQPRININYVTRRLNFLNNRTEILQKRLLELLQLLKTF